MNEGFIITRIDEKGKRTYQWSVPRDLHIHGRRLNKSMFGIGTWRDTKKRFLCITHPDLEHPIYISLEALKSLKGW